MMRTQSEIWLQQFFENRDVPLRRISETNDGRTPDYELDLFGQRVIVEVKEFVPNADERASIAMSQRNGVGAATGEVIGERVRRKISDAVPQLKARTEGILPGMLVLCDIKYGCGQISGHTDPSNIRAAMDGLDEMLVVVPSSTSEAPYLAGMKSGPRKKLTKKHNTSVSAIAVLFTPPNEGVSMIVYHNRHAALPIGTDLIERLDVRQYKLSGEPGAVSVWAEI